MSKLDRLIAELCPDGVEFVKLEEVADIGTGSNNTVDGRNKGMYPFFVRSQEVRYMDTYEFDETAIITSGDGVGVGKIFHYIEGKYALHQRAYRIHIRDDRLFPKFYYCYMTAKFYDYISMNAFHASVTSVRRPMLNNFRVPIPPLPIQHEIVRILDNFTELTAELKKELSAELTARKKQYEYYRNVLLSFGDNVKRAQLNEIGIMIRGTYITKKQTSPGDVPVILGGQEPAYYCDTGNHDGEAIVMSRSGAYAGFVYFWNQPIFVTDGFIIKTKDGLKIKYLYYYLKNMQESLHQMKRGGGVPHVRGNEIMELIIPIPALDEQERIVSILDRFDALTNDISSGLPAEIAARQKQYEYYRDKLLTFRRGAINRAL